MAELAGGGIIRFPPRGGAHFFRRGNQVIFGQRPDRKRPAKRIRQKLGTQIRKGKAGPPIARTGEPNQFTHRLVLNIQTVQVHAEQLVALLIGGTVELLRHRRPAHNGGVQCPCPVGAEKYENAAGMAAKVIDFLDDGVNGHFIFMVALHRVARGSKRVAFVDNKEGLPGFSGLLGYDFKCLVEKGAHLTDLARSADAGA